MSSKLHPVPRDVSMDPGTTTSGGCDLAEVLPVPHVRRFCDSDRKRCISIRIIRWSGVGVHYYARLEEEHDPVWNGKVDEFHPTHGTWQTCRDDIEGRGRHFSKQCRTVEAAETFVRDTLREHFPETTHRYDWCSWEDSAPPRWFYKDGD